ncbi:MAG: protein-L-isoaspartate O-methyltransferase [Sphingomicrobium sp.]
MTIHTPIPDYAEARRAMVESQLRPEGVTDRGVLEAMRQVAREEFIPAEVRPLAYTDRSIALGNHRFLAPAAVLGKLLTEAAPVAGERALVVGAGTGYSAAVLARIGLDVLALECSSELATQARALDVAVVEGPLQEGHKGKSPYQLILIDGAVEKIPDAIVDQLADGGRLVGAIVDRRVSRLIVGRKAGSAFGYVSIGDAGVATLPGFSSPRTFAF